MGGTMRLGADPVKLHDGTRVRELYDEPVVYERHRHRYEVNNHLRRRLEAARTRLLGHLARRAARRGDRARAGTTTRSSSPRSTTRSSSRGPSARRRCSASSSARRWLASDASADEVRSETSDRRALESRRVARREARHRGRTRAAARHVRLALPDREPVRPRAAVRRLRRRRAPRDRARRSTRTTPDRRRAPTPATCSRGSPGTGPQSIMLCAHLDTVPPTAPIEPVLVDGGWENANDGILGADNKAAVAVHARACAPARQRAATPPAVGLELVFTVSEENGLHGAKAFDVGRCAASFGYVFDHAIADRRDRDRLADLPARRRRAARARRARRHPPRGRAQRDRRRRAGDRGDAARAPRRRDDGERRHDRGRHRDERRARALPRRGRGAQRSPRSGWRRSLTAMIDHLQDAADAAECDLDVTVERMFTRLPARSRARRTVALAERALRACGYEPRPIVTGGGSDANAFEAAGFAVREPRQRHRAQPPARRARQRRRARGDARRRDRAGRGGRGGPVS